MQQQNGSEHEENDERNSNSNSMDSMNQRDPRKQNNFYDNGRDPRQRNSSNDRFNNSGPPGNFIQTDCVIMKNMDTGTNIEDVELFYKDIGIYKMRVHILLDKQGQPCGDCFVEFKYPNDSQRALAKNNQMLGPNRVQVMLIPREQVEAVLSSFGGGAGSTNDDRPPFSNNSNNNNSNKRDWEPPSDFGTPNCVVMLSNLCYRATIDDILDEFHEFDLRPEQIIRRYNDDGRPTGNACINFNSPNDATHAIETKNAVKLLNRPVYMKRV
jgi:RNA recognition motif-containing protein